ncbi:MAG: hypothetical protein IJM44_07550 [Ruminococcus sp.]|nr:hypothetical protein [Ruminococcus sp.]
MIRVSGVRAELSQDFSDLRGLCEKRLKIAGNDIKSVRLARKSVDARRKSDVHFILSLDIEARGEEKLLRHLKNAVRHEPAEYEITPVSSHSERPVIVGFGPAGMLAALVLAMSGAKPIVLERGADVDTRVRSVETFRNGGPLDPECNVQFGEGGAGTFSDGKLNTGISDGRIGWILRRFAEFGAPEDILTDAKPHIGTDRLREVVKNLRERVIALGGEVRFNSKFTGYELANGCISRIFYTDSHGSHAIDSHYLILAAGHSARDVFELLHSKNVTMSQKNFSVGVRIEHRREDIDKAMYGGFAGHPALKAASYKLAVHLPSGRSLYTFCMCPGGYVMAAASEEGRLAVNGMSCSARDAENSNSALLVGIGPGDFGSSHPLAGMYLQRELEERAFTAGGSDYRAPAVTVGDFLERRKPGKLGKVRPSYKPGVRLAPPEEYLPEFVCEALRDGIIEMGKKLRGFDDPEAVLTGIESRSSSPVRIERNSALESPDIAGFYPCGEGAGHAGGIVSAAVDGMKCAEAVIAKMNGGKV